MRSLVDKKDAWGTLECQHRPETEYAVFRRCIHCEFQ